jgi:elongation factor 1 alpha-like protein
MSVEVIRGRLSVPGKIEELVGVLDKSSGAVIAGGKGKKKVRVVKPGQLARVKVVLERGVPLESPGRVVLRSGGETVAAGLLE